MERFLPSNVLTYISIFLTNKELVFFFSTSRSIVSLLRTIPIKIKRPFLLNKVTPTLYIAEAYLRFDVAVELPPFLEKTLRELTYQPVFRDHKPITRKRCLSFFTQCTYLTSLKVEKVSLSFNYPFVLPHLISLSLIAIIADTTFENIINSTTLPALESFSLQDSRVDSVSFLSTLCNLHTLSLSGNTNIRGTFGSEYCTALTALHMDDCGISLETDWGKHHPHLINLTLSGNSTITDLQYFRSLYKLDDTLISKILRLSTLQELRLFGIKQDFVFPSLNLLPNLTALYISGMYMEEQVTLIAPQLRKLTFTDGGTNIDISRLDLTHLTIKKDYILETLPGLSKNTNLQSLEIDTCIRLEHLELGIMNKLSTLKLKSNYATISLISCSNLRELELYSLQSESNITGLLSCTKLEKINIIQCDKLFEKGSFILQENLQTVEIVGNMRYDFAFNCPHVAIYQKKEGYEERYKESLISFFIKEYKIETPYCMPYYVYLPNAKRLHVKCLNKNSNWLRGIPLLRDLTLTNGNNRQLVLLQEAPHLRSLTISIYIKPNTIQYFCRLTQLKYLIVKPLMGTKYTSEELHKLAPHLIVCRIR